MPKKTMNVEPNRVYCFCGNGQGVPGLPHEVTKSQAEVLGLLEHLSAALQRGDYKPVKIDPADSYPRDGVRAHEAPDAQGE